MTTVAEGQTKDGFATAIIRNECLALTVVPELGARIISIYSIQRGHEWLWRPADNRGLFKCAPGSRFECSPLAGIDECLPNIDPCRYEGVQLGDHGEVWARPWKSKLQGKIIATDVTVESLGLEFSRNISLAGSKISISYSLKNSRGIKVRYVWALHALFNFTEMNRVELSGPASLKISAARSPFPLAGLLGTWPSPYPGVSLETGNLGQQSDVFCKAFISCEAATSLLLRNQRWGEGLKLSLSPSVPCYWGYWLTKKGWHGHKHLALEPTNAPVDTPVELNSDDPAWTLEPGKTACWSVGIELKELLS